jgi:hypothetical protein
MQMRPARSRKNPPAADLPVSMKCQMINLPDLLEKSKKKKFYVAFADGSA